MNVVNLSDFVSDFSCRYDSEMKPIVSHKFFNKSDLVDSIQNDTKLFDLYGTLYIYRSYFMLMNGVIVQKVLERCMEFMSTSPHAVPQYMFKSVMRRKKADNKVLTNNYRNDDSVRSVSINTIISFVNEVIESKIVENHFSEYEVFVKKIDDISEKYFPGYNIQMVLLDDVLQGSEFHTQILSGQSVKNPHNEHLKKINESLYIDKSSSFSNTVEKELLFYNLFVTQFTRNNVDMLISNIFIAFNECEIKNYRDTLTKNIVFINRSNNTTCFTSWEDMRNWVHSNSIYVSQIVEMLKGARNGEAVLPKESSVLYDYFTVFKRPLFDHVDALAVGSTFEEVEQNKNRQKLFSGMENILERQLGNK